MPNEPAWLTADEAVELNQFAVANTGETHFLRDRRLLEGAVDSCRNHFVYSNNDLVDLACTLMMTIARCHAFEQGNKRTGFLAARAFLALNGHTLEVPDRQWLADLLIAAVSDRAAEAVIRAGIRPYVSVNPSLTGTYLQLRLW